MNPSLAHDSELAPIVIMAGGTGGHIFPALAVAKLLQAAKCSVTWIGTENSMESRLVPQHGVPIRFINISGVRGKGLKAKLSMPYRLVRAVLQARRILREINPAAVLGMGGFVTGPGGIAAWISRKPLLIHEQNAVAGMTNRYLAKVAKHVYEAFPNSFVSHEKMSVQCVGNPVRADIMQLHSQQKALVDNSRPINLLVVGGSLGALVLNETVPLAISQLLVEKKITQEQINIRHQAGQRTFKDANEAYRKADVQAEVVEFIDDMAEAYAWADIIICRSGALTISEVSAAGVPAIFVPFPHAVDDHQRKNAQVLVDAHAAELIVQTDLTPIHLANTLLSLIDDPKRLNEMSSNSKSVAQLQASEIIAEQCLKYAGAML